MHTTLLLAPSRLVLAAAAALAMLAGTASAQPGPVTGSVDARPSPQAAAITRRDTRIDDSGMYRSEVQACLSGRSQQAKETCLEEARNARADRRRGRLAPTNEDYTANALARCGPLTGENRAACEARVLGFGGSTGSVEGGGVLRWVETVVVPQGQGQVRFSPQTTQPVVVLHEGRY